MKQLLYTYIYGEGRIFVHSSKAPITLPPSLLLKKCVGPILLFVYAIYHSTRYVTMFYLRNRIILKCYNIHTYYFNGFVELKPVQFVFGFCDFRVKSLSLISRSMLTTSEPCSVFRRKNGGNFIGEHG
jgi:hypothetical protein